MWLVFVSSCLRRGERGASCSSLWERDGMAGLKPCSWQDPSGKSFLSLAAQPRLVPALPNPFLLRNFYPRAAAPARSIPHACTRRTHTCMTSTPQRQHECTLHPRSAATSVQLGKFHISLCLRTFSTALASLIGGSTHHHHHHHYHHELNHKPPTTNPQPSVTTTTTPACTPA